MAAINALSRVSTLSLADLIPLFSNSAGLDSAATIGTLLDLITESLPVASEVIQYAAPSGSGFVAQVLDVDEGVNVFYQITPGGAYAAGGVLMPSAPWDGMRVNVHCSQAVTTFSLTGGTMHGAPTTLAAGGFFTMRYDAASSGWWRSA